MASFSDFFNDDLRARGKSNHKFRALDEIDKKLSWLNTTLANVPSKINEDIQNRPTELPSTAASSNHVASEDVVTKHIQKTIQIK